MTTANLTHVDATDLASRRKLALERVDELIAQAQQAATRAWRYYYRVQVATVALAALTPCLILLAKESPGNALFNWLQIFLPALAAICAGATHIFHWREDGVRYTALAEAIRSQLWRFQTRSGEFASASTEEQALGQLVTRVDDIHSQSVAHWSAQQLAAPTLASPPRRADT